MARMQCKCGNILSNSEAPNDVQLRVFTDKEWDDILSNDIIETWKIKLPDREVWHCLKCERIYVFENGLDKATKVYKIEKGD